MAYYRAGETPLVGWLKPFMLPEIVGVNVDECFKVNNTNVDTTTTHAFINAFEQTPGRMRELRHLADMKKRKEEGDGTRSGDA
jgi:hypothetical protein